jgi:uncharacterized membrane protein YoaK (UPF0700 family)
MVLFLSIRVAEAWTPISVAFLATVLILPVLILWAVVLWQVFEKAGNPGWMGVVPILNLYVLVKMAGKPGWWVLLYLIPIVGLVIYLVVAIEISKNFGQSPWFAVGLFFFSLIFYAILGFGSATWQGPGPAFD